MNRSLLPRCLVEEQSRLLGRILVLDRWSFTKPQRCLFCNNDTSHSMDSKSTNCYRSQELRAMEREVFSWRTTSLLGATLMQTHIQRCSRRNDQFANMRQMPKQLSMVEWSNWRWFLLSHLSNFILFSICFLFSFLPLPTHITFFLFSIPFFLFFTIFLLLCFFWYNSIFISIIERKRNRKTSLFFSVNYYFKNKTNFFKRRPLFAFNLSLLLSITFADQL